MFPTRASSHLENYPELDSGERSDPVAMNRQCFSESVPLKSSNQERPHFCSPKRNGLKIIISTLIIISLATTVALIVEIYNHKADVLKPHSMIVSDNRICSELGISLLSGGGSAIDGVVATVLCLGVVHPHDTGIGGGGFMLVHDHKNGKTVSFDFRESVPSAVFDGNVTMEHGTVGIPGLLHGLYTAHKRYGKLPWAEVVKPAVRVCKNGFYISPYLNQTIHHGNSSTVQNLFFKKTGEAVKFLKRKNLATVLDMIAVKGIEDFYNGSIGKRIVEEANKFGAQLSVEDFSNYSTIESDPLEINWKGFTLQTSPIPSNGPVLLKALKQLKNLSADPKMNNSLPVDIILEAVRSAFSDYAKLYVQTTKQNTSEFVERVEETFSFSQRESRGSAVVAVDDDELFVSLVSGLGSWFGSDIVTSDGIILNDALMDVRPEIDFNSIKNGSRRNWHPSSTLTPFIMYDKANVCGLRLAAGGASPTLVLQPILRKTLLGYSTQAAVEAPRFDIAFSEKKLYFEQEHEPHFENMMFNALTMDGYEVSSITEPYISVNMMAKENDETSGQADSRGGGSLSET